MREFVQRVWTGAIGICLLIVALILIEQSWFPPIVAVCLAIIASIGYWEFCNFARAKAFSPPVLVGIIAGWVYIAVHYIGIYSIVRQGMVIGVAEGAVLFLTGLALLMQCLIQRRQPLASLALAAFGIVYVVIPLSLAIDILYNLPAQSGINGRWWIIYIVGVTVFTDMGAYFVGKAMGKHRWVPHISPGKSLEGTIGGVIVGVIAGMIIYLFNRHDISWWGALILAFCLTLVGQLGDLAESLFKRDAGVKDSNRLPGLGGVLDIIDSLLLNLPLTFIVLRWMIGVSR